MNIWCCNCQSEIVGRLTDGLEIYPSWPKLAHKPFWKCDTCGGYVGCHPDTRVPLGIIPTPRVRKLRLEIHNVLDRLWKSGKMKRKHVYARLSQHLGKPYHTGELATEEEGQKVLSFLQTLKVSQ